MRVREEEMSLVCDLVSSVCLWAIRWREGQSLETDFCSVTPKSVGGGGIPGQRDNAEKEM